MIAPSSKLDPEEDDLLSTRGHVHLARAAQSGDDAAALRQHMKVILALVDKTLSRGRK